MTNPDRSLEHAVRSGDQEHGLRATGIGAALALFCTEAAKVKAEMGKPPNGAFD